MAFTKQIILKNPYVIKVMVNYVFSKRSMKFEKVSSFKGDFKKEWILLKMVQMNPALEIVSVKEISLNFRGPKLK